MSSTAITATTAAAAATTAVVALYMGGVVFSARQFGGPAPWAGYRKRKLRFFDRIGSNNAARIRLWLALRGLNNLKTAGTEVEIILTSHADQKTDSFKKMVRASLATSLTHARRSLAECWKQLDNLEAIW